MWDSAKACDLLRQRNITTIRVHGDSLLRHVWQGVILLTTGQPHFSFNGRPACRGPMGFSERSCRANAGAIIDVCDNIQVSYHRDYKPPNNDNINNKNGRTLNLYGEGNHAPDRAQSPVGRKGILNATAYAQRTWKAMDGNPNFWGTNDYFLHLAPHYKIRIGRWDESNPRAKVFGEESAQFFAKLNAWTLPTYELTRTAVPFLSFVSDDGDCRAATNRTQGYYDQQTCEPTLETWDGYHFGQGINLMKANLVFHWLQHQTQ